MPPCWYDGDMKRTQIQLDDRTYQALRRAAHDQGRSMSSVAREAIARGLDVAPEKRRLTMRDFESMIGMGASDDGDLAPVSVNHDEALAEALYEDIRRGQEEYRRQEELRKRNPASVGSARSATRQAALPSRSASADRPGDK